MSDNITLDDNNIDEIYEGCIVLPPDGITRFGLERAVAPAEFIIDCDELAPNENIPSDSISPPLEILP